MPSPPDGSGQVRAGAGRRRPILQLVLKGEPVPDGSSVGIDYLRGDEKGKKGQMQPLKPSSETILGYLWEDTAGDLVYESVIESQAGGDAAESMIALVSDENRRFPHISKADHARRVVRSMANMMRNPTWEVITLKQRADATSPTSS